MFGEMKIEIFDPEGELLKTLPGGKRKGMNFVDLVAAAEAAQGDAVAGAGSADRVRRQRWARPRPRAPTPTA